MSNDKNHSEQFERYLKGQMSPEEANAFEREVLDDPFATEALEGYEGQDLSVLNDIEKLRGRVSAQKRKSFPFMKIAAAVALLFVASLTVYFLTTQVSGDQLAMEKEPVEELSQSSPKPDTIRIDSKKEIQVAEDIQTDTFKKNGLKVEGENDIVVNLDHDVTTDIQENLISENVPDNEEADQPEGNGQDLLLAETEERIEPEDDASDLLQGRAAGVQIAETRSEPKPDYIDTSELEEVVVMAQPLVAKKESFSSALSEIEEPKAKKSAVARSRSTANEIVTGMVTDDYGEPLPGVNVVIKGTTTGTVTDIDGSYQLPKSDDMILTYAFVGFESQEIEVGDRSNIDVKMGGAMELQEVVVTGYSNVTSTGYTPAKPIGGNKSYKKYLDENLRYPEAARINEIEGTVVLELTIDPSGAINQIDIKKSLGYGCDEEAIRLVKEGPMWTAAKKDGITVEDKVRVRVTFKL
ncbi:TonB family protein [Ekhidna sp.]|uniref:energy transducer TonB n=1 Tax=Ekhidna sp. TaxID=2608089 RepID=UPI0035165537